MSDEIQLLIGRGFARLRLRHRTVLGAGAVALWMALGCGSETLPTPTSDTVIDVADVIAPRSDTAKMPDTPPAPQPCPVGAVCGGDEPIVCEPPVTFAADPTDGCRLYSRGVLSCRLRLWGWISRFV